MRVEIVEREVWHGHFAYVKVIALYVPDGVSVPAQLRKATLKKLGIEMTVIGEGCLGGKTPRSALVAARERAARLQQEFSALVYLAEKLQNRGKIDETK